MYCSICGTKLKDDERFCPNCGSKVEREETNVNTVVNEPVKVEPVETVVTEPVKVEPVETVVTESVKVEPVETVVNEPVKVEPVETVVNEPVKVEPVEMVVTESVKVEETVSQPVKEQEPAIEVLNANGPIIENPTAETIKNPVTNSQPAKKAKKKKKTWLIVLIVLLAIFIVLPIVVVVLILLVILVCSLFGVGGLTLGAILSGPVEKPEVDTSYIQTISKYYGDYHGTSAISATYNSKELVNFLDSLGITVDEESLHTDLSASEYAISIYSDAYSDASWDMLIDYGDSFGYQSISNISFVTYDDFYDDFYVLGDMNIDSDTEEFYISVSDYDTQGVFNELLGIDEDLMCEYSLKFYGTADGDSIDGVYKVTFLYDGMSKPFSEEIEVHAER